jgi:hypothetical protein
MPLKILIVDEPENLKVMRSLTNVFDCMGNKYKEIRKSTARGTVEEKLEGDKC